MPFSYQHSSSSSSSLLFLPYSFRRRALALCSQPPLTHYMSLKPSSRAAHIRCYHGGLCCTSISEILFMFLQQQQQQQQLFFLFLLMVWPESHLITYAHSSLTCPICISNCRFIGISLCVSSFLKKGGVFPFFDKKIKSPFFKNSLGI